MFTIKNLRKKKKGDWTYLIVDFDVTDMESPFEEKTMWFAVENKNADMLTDDVYDAFALVPLYLGMHYHQDVHIEGKISPRLYHNITHYLMKIFDGFSTCTNFVNFKVDGYMKPKASSIDLVATGISCGVDSLTTIYDNFVQDTDIDLKINSLFLVNCGTHGDFEDRKTRNLWLKRAELNKRAADELGLPMYLIDSNIHHFTHKIGENRLGYLAIYCCFMSVQRYVKRYLAASSSSYDDNLRYALSERDIDMAGYCEIFMPHLLSTERIELVIDGCQYTRPEKIEKICDWDISKKYLNVCLEPRKDGGNCATCQKCMRTLIVLDAIGKIKNYSDIFDIEKYKHYKFLYKCWLMTRRDIQAGTHVEYLKNKGIFLPNRFFSKIVFFIFRIIRKIRKILGIYNKEQDLKC